MSILKLLSSFVLFLSFESAAYTVFNPPSDHKLYESYGQFFDNQSMIAFRSGGRAWSAVGASAAMVEFQGENISQLVIHSSLNTSLEGKLSNSTVHVETMDIRIGLAYEYQFTDSFRGALIYTHQSGHVADNVPDLDLMGPDLGNEMFDFRLVKDVGRTFRIGGGPRPILISNPRIKSMGGEEFFEYFPGGASSNRNDLSPFIAFGMEQYGVHGIINTINVQAGWVAGAHFGQHPPQSLRFVLGYYNGYDPRLKYFQFKDHKDEFGYLAFCFEM